MKKIIIIFVIIEMLDIITTIIGLHFGFQETNLLVASLGWGKTNLLKILFIFSASIFLNWGYKYLPKLFIFYGFSIIVASGIPVGGNIVLLLN